MAQLLPKAKALIEHRSDIEEHWQFTNAENPSTLCDCCAQTGNMKRRRASAARVSSALKSALAGVGERPKDRAGVLVHDLTKVHGDGEQEDQEEKVDAKE